MLESWQLKKQTQHLWLLFVSIVLYGTEGYHFLRHNQAYSVFPFVHKGSLWGNIVFITDTQNLSFHKRWRIICHQRHCYTQHARHSYVCKIDLFSATWSILSLDILLDSQWNIHLEDMGEPRSHKATKMRANV